MEKIWTDELVFRLKRLWKNGVPTGRIGAELGVTKNAVCGKVRRLELTPRGSPIKPTRSIASGAESEI